MTSAPSISAADVDTAMSAARREPPKELAPRSAGQMAGFEDSAGAVGQLAMHAGTAGSVAREEAELKAAVVLARTMPRNELAAFEKIIRSCGRPGFADNAIYSFPRGNSTIEGPSVKLARDLARCWGNMRHGLRIVTITKEDVHVKGFAFDLETNTYIEAEAKFARLHQRKIGGKTQWVEPDERDLRELVNRHGAFCVRNCILHLLPPDVISDALAACNATLERAAKGELEQNRDDAVRRLVVAFGKFSVTADMLGKKLGHALQLVTEKELTDLRKVYASLIDGNSTVPDHFDIGKPAGDAPPADAAPQSKGEDVLNKLRSTEQGASGGQSAPAQTTAPTPEAAAQPGQGTLMPGPSPTGTVDRSGAGSAKRRT